MKYLIILFFIFIAGCAENNNTHTSDIINSDNVSTIYDFVYSEEAVIYSIAGEYNTGAVNKDEILEINV